ncbi:MAG: thioredoxin domain-containing protein [Dehalococcoidia bacterium]
MQSKGYLFTVLLVTVVTLAIGVALWHSGTQELSIDKECTGWCRGAEEPIVVIGTFPDFICSICVNREKLVIQALEIYPDEVRVDYHHYYPTTHEFSFTLGEALECAGEQGMFWELHDKFYLGQAPVNMSEILTAAESIGLDMVLFTDSLNSGKFSDKIMAEQEEALANGAEWQSTYINRVKYTGSSTSLEEFCNAIDAAIEKARAMEDDQ